MVDVEPEEYTLAQNDAVRKTSAFLLINSERQILVAMLGILLVVRILAMFWLPFIDTTEARYAEIARKMLETGDWITPQFEYGIPFWGKPPLHTWLSALGMKIFGVSHFGARFFILLSSLGVLSLCYVWVRKARGIDEALVAIAVMVSSVLFFGASAFVMTDMAMALGTTMSMVGFYVCARDQSSGKLWGYLFFVGLAIGLLAKGPVAVVLTLMPIFLWLAVGNRWRRLAHLPWITGLMITALIAMPWYLAAEEKTPGFLRYFIVGEHYERFVVPGWQGDLYGSAHVRPKGLIWALWLEAFMPWTLFAAALMLKGKQVLAVFRKDRTGWYSYLLFWALSPLILFTPAANILAAYVLPGIPAAAILLVSIWIRVFGAPRWRTRLSVFLSMGSVAVVFFVLIALAFFSPNTLELKSERELIARARQASPNIAITYWGERSFSAEFYTQGRVSFVKDAADLSALRSNEVRDALAVRGRDLQELKGILDDGFVNLGRFGRRYLFIEPKTKENNS